ncbi:MAG: leucine-rich repeat protein [Alistipes sp.]|nr:leucine-rich repeat protein [Alistipes sp.]
MRRFFITTLLLTLLIGCTPIDIDKELSKRDEQIAKLEELCNKINGDIESLKSLIEALQNNDTVTSVTPIIIDGAEVGYTISFTNSDPINIYHGTDGKDSENIFHSITEDDEFVYLTLIDGSTITIQKGEKRLHNKIYYTTTNDNKLFPATTEPSLFGAILISNTYRNGVGVMVFDDNISIIGNGTFQNCLNLKSITIPDAVTEIDKNAFRGCSNLSEVIIGQGVTTINSCAFQDCVSLRNITIPRSIRLWLELQRV